MTTSDISEAQRLARECVEKNYRVVELKTPHPQNYPLFID